MAEEGGAKSSAADAADADATDAVALGADGDNQIGASQHQMEVQRAQHQDSKEEGVEPDGFRLGQQQEQQLHDQIQEQESSDMEGGQKEARVLSELAPEPGERVVTDFVKVDARGVVETNSSGQEEEQKDKFEQIQHRDDESGRMNSEGVESCLVGDTAKGPGESPKVPQPHQGRASSTSVTAAPDLPPFTPPSSSKNVRSHHHRKSVSRSGRSPSLRGGGGSGGSSGAPGGGGGNGGSGVGPPRKCIANFMVGKLLGEGAYARVHVCKLKNSDELYAVKVMEKRFIVKEGKVNFVNMEKKVLSLVDHPLIAKLYFSFHDSRYLYLVMDLCKGGELQKYIRHRADEQLTRFGITNRACSLDETRFYVSETIAALQHLHSLGFIHRDVKPDNILITESRHIKLTDFGTVKDEREQNTRQTPVQASSESGRTPGARRGTFCGTAEYVSPEVLQDQDPSVAADLWAIGCMVYQMLIGRPPFRGGSEYFTFQLIMNHGNRDELLAFPNIEYDMESPNTLSASSGPAPLAKAELEDAQTLVNALLQPNPLVRLGAGNNCTPHNPMYDANSANGPQALRSHPFFEQVNWDDLPNQEAPPLPYSIDIPEPTFDGASDDWMMAGDITELEMAASLEVSQTPSPVLDSPLNIISSPLTPPPPGEIGIINDSPVGKVSPESGMPSNPSVLSSPSSGGRTVVGELSQFLKANEHVVLDGLVVKRKSLFHTNTRHLILTDLPRFLYVDPVKVVLKGEIPIDSHVFIHVKNSKTFDIVTPKRTYHITDLMSQAKRWQTAFQQLPKSSR
mmetsp:Transcript_9201/g.18089  ORF Transcript_9201/g.18089 Transcript_9201/m.18089 type:complete len:795 (-) Transcript_9201:181-2565(-)